MDASIKLKRRRRLVQRLIAPPLASLLHAIDTGNVKAIEMYAASLAEQFTEYTDKVERNGYAGGCADREGASHAGI